MEVVCNWSQSFITDSAPSLTSLAQRCQPQLRVALSPSGQSLLRQTPTENWRRPAAPKTDREHIFPKRREPTADAVDKIILAKVSSVKLDSMCRRGEEFKSEEHAKH
ncbi:Hypothetical predicted protein [Scomber scombrus]|uniref:Uncharacterized protein n=1 Tax=Scomber scombrus TaxID=13677 RepID=A0AAV1N8Y0_SCOSC